MSRREHSDLEDALDRLPSVSDPAFRPEFQSLLDRLVRHYRVEEDAFPGPRFDKMRAQHQDAAELGDEVLRSLDAGQTADAARLLARFLALARHNMIEEERDVFPYYHRKL